MGTVRRLPTPPHATKANLAHVRALADIPTHNLLAVKNMLDQIDQRMAGGAVFGIDGPLEECALLAFFCLGKILGLSPSELEVPLARHVSGREPLVR